MARANDVVPLSPQAKGYNMITKARESHAHNSLAQGRYMTGVADAAQNATGSPGAALGTGMNTDRYTPGIEAV